jgi:hypothetical protein
MADVERLLFQYNQHSLCKLNFKLSIYVENTHDKLGFPTTLVYGLDRNTKV